MSETYKDHGHPPGWENEHDPRCQACAQSELASSAGSGFSVHISGLNDVTPEFAAAMGQMIECAKDYMTKLQAPSQEGWFWAKGKLGWTCVKVREVAGRWMGLNPYTGTEHDLHFPHDDHWDGIEWHGPALPPDSQNAAGDSTRPAPSTPDSK